MSRGRGSRIQQGRRGQGRGQGGASLLEVALAIMLMGISLLSFAGLLYTTMASSASHRARVQAGNRATAVAERIDDLLYVGCPDAANSGIYGAALDLSPGRLFDEEIVHVEFLQDRKPSKSTWGPCPSNDQGAQRLTVRVTTRQAPVVSADLVVVKRNTLCPAGMSEGAC